MNALDNLMKHSIVNSDDHFKYPKTPPAINCMTNHVEIYKLIDEYVKLYNDYDVVTSETSKELIETRLKEIESELLLTYWIVKAETV